MHIHHYVLSLIVLSFLGYQSVFLTVVHGAFNGIFIEGASHWGLDPIWIYPSDTSNEIQHATSVTDPKQPTINNSSQIYDVSSNSTAAAAPNIMPVLQTVTTQDFESGLDNPSTTSSDSSSTDSDDDADDWTDIII